MKGIHLFMWAYQPHFRILLERRMNDVLSDLGVLDPGSECLLVGARVPGRQNPNRVCVEPEDGKWPLGLFDGLLDVVETEVASHPLQDVFYSHAPSMRDKPENIRRDAVRRAVQKALDGYDADHDVRSFAGGSARVDDYYVVPVIQLPIELFKRYRPLPEPVSHGDITGEPSLIHAAVSVVLEAALDELARPDPGHSLFRSWSSSKESARRAAEYFMRTPGLAIGDLFDHALFEHFNSISSKKYEGKKGVGRLLLANPDGGSVDIILRFAEPVPLSEPSWSRKVLQVASSENALVADYERVFGLGTIAAGVDPWTSQDVFAVEFLDHYRWRLMCGDEVMLVSTYGAPSLRSDRYPISRLLDTYQRLFTEAGEEDIGRFRSLFSAAVNQRHGSMLVVARDAESEADRLQGQGTRLEPLKLTPELYRQVSRIDGAVMIDPQCTCHAIGVILDGQAALECTPSRGARYNSGVRYVRAADGPRLALVVSDDGMVNVIPTLRPRIKHSGINIKIAELESSTSQDYHSAISWLDRHRFYLDRGECDRINAALNRITSEPGEIRLQWREFSPHPALDDSYFEIEEVKPKS